MNQMTSFLALIRSVIIDPTASGRALIAMNPPMMVRWMLMVAAVLVSVLILFAGPMILGASDPIVTPLSFSLAQILLNVIGSMLIAHVGRMFGGTGTFADALWLMGWLQVLTAVILPIQFFLLIIPGLTTLFTFAALGVSLWVLTGFVCAIHGFTSKLMVLVGGIMVVTLVSFILSAVLFILGYGPSGVGSV